MHACRSTLEDPTVEIELPALRTRGAAEIEALARHFADMYARKYGRPAPRFEPAALDAMRAHTWPGNVRELEHWVESAIVLSPSGVLGAALAPTAMPHASSASSASSAVAADAPSAPGASLHAPHSGDGHGVFLPLGLSLDEAARRYMEATVDACDGNKAEAARRLAIGRNTITRILKG